MPKGTLDGGSQSNMRTSRANGRRAVGQGGRHRCESAIATIQNLRSHAIACASLTVGDIDQAFCTAAYPRTESPPPSYRPSQEGSRDIAKRSMTTSWDQVATPVRSTNRSLPVMSPFHPEHELLTDNEFIRDAIRQVVILIKNIFNIVLKTGFRIFQIHFR